MCPSRSNNHWCSLHRNSSEWSDLWMRGDKNTERVEKHPLKEQLTIKNLKSSDEGLYQVLDEQGLAVSSIQLSVEGERPQSPESLGWSVESSTWRQISNSSCFSLFFIIMNIWSTKQHSWQHQHLGNVIFQYILIKQKRLSYDFILLPCVETKLSLTLISNYNNFYF